MNERPAILGGPPAARFPQPEIDAALSWPNPGEMELDAIARVFRDHNISTHPVIGELETAYQDFSGRKHAIAHCNGTTALMAAFWSLDLQPGDQVLVPSATFWASVLPMMWMGLVPVFCEIEADTLSLDIADMLAKWTPRVKAMVIVPLWGLPPDYDTLLEFAREKGLKVIEDASHAHGAKYRGKPCGSFGDVSVLSLQGDKLAPAGEGGVLLTDDDAIRERVICLGDITRIYQLESPARRFAATSHGIKTRIAPVSAAIGICQLRKLPETNRIRNENLRGISDLLETHGFDTYPDRPETERVHFEYLVRWKEGPLDADGWRRALAAEGCSAELPRYPLLHQQPFFTGGDYRRILRLSGEDMPDYSTTHLPRTEALNADMMKLPVFPNTAPGLTTAYQAAIRKVGAHQEEIADFMAGNP